MSASPRRCRLLSAARPATGALGLAAGAAAGLALANRLLLLDDLPPTLPGAAHDWRWRGWRVRYTTLGDGPPLVLVHGVHAAASSFEMRGIFEPLARTRTVYALDLLGFGKSERPDAPYSGAFYAALLADFLDFVVGEPATVLASSLAAAYAVSAAATRPTLVRRLILISPTGTTTTGPLGRLAGQLLGLPLVGTAAFNALVSRASIRWFLGRVYADPASVDEQLVAQSWATAHQPNARLAPAAFVAGRLDLPLEVARGQVRAAVLVLNGEAGALGHVATDDELRALGPDITIRTVRGAGQLPHDEAPDAVLALLTAWLGSRA